MSTDQTPALARAAKADNHGVGWYEVIHPTAATTLLAYVHEDGSVYFPETNDGRAEFEFAAARGKVHRLVRADDAEHALAVVSAALRDPDDPDWLARVLDAHVDTGAGPTGAECSCGVVMEHTVDGATMDIYVSRHVADAVRAAILGEAS